MTTATPSVSRTWRFHFIGGPEVLQLDELPVPEPGVGEVRLRVLACGLNRSDLLWMSAQVYQPELPARVGYEVCGVVDALGEGVTEVAVGDRVSNFVNVYIGDYANFADYAVLPVRSLRRTPANLSDVEGAAFTSTYLTNYCGLVEYAGIKPWQHVLITAATSATGLSAIAVARKAGATVIATTRQADRSTMLEEAGAQHVVVTSTDDLPARVAEITNEMGCELIYDCIGGQMTDALLQCVAMHGHWIQYGILDPSPVQVVWPAWFAKQPKLSFYSLIQYSGGVQGQPGRPEAFARALRYVFEGVGEGSLPVPISREFQGIESVADAFRAMAGDLGGGKIVVRF